MLLLIAARISSQAFESVFGRKTAAVVTLVTTVFAIEA
jgi:hypothetical protein